jgi:hypothetical protein
MAFALLDDLDLSTAMAAQIKVRLAIDDLLPARLEARTPRP